MGIIDAYPFIVAVGRCLSTLAVGTLLGETCAIGLVHCVNRSMECVLTKDVEVLNELPLGAGLVRGTEDIGEQTTGEDTAQDTVSLDVRLVETAGSLATVTLVLVLVDGGGRAVGSNAEGEGEGSDNGGEVHCDGFWFSENERKCSSKGALEKSEDALRNWKIELL